MATIIDPSDKPVPLGHDVILPNVPGVTWEVNGIEYPSQEAFTETQECWFASLTDETPTVEANQTFGVPTAVWLAPLGVDIAEGDRIMNLIDGSLWVVTSILTPRSNVSISTRCGIREAGKGEVS